jgi:hypothetical protein
MVYYPALITSAIFFAAIIVNLKNQNNANAFGIGMLAIPSILFLTYLSQKKMDILAYFLLLVPIVIVIAGYEMGIKREAPVVVNDSSSSSSSSVDVVTPRIESKEGAATSCKRCSVSPCMCPYKPTYN